MGLAQQILGIQHLGIITGKLNEDVSWYEDKLGFEKTQQRVVPMNGRTEIAILSRQGIHLELVEPAGRLKEEAKARKSGKWDHFAIEAPNLEELAVEANKKGLVWNYSTPKGITEYIYLKEKGVMGVNYTGPSGEVIEFCRDNDVNYRGRKGLLGWSHLALKVENMERTEEFYGKLGFSKTGEGYLPTVEGDIRIHYLNKSDFTLEILEMVGTGLRRLRENGEGPIDHVAFQVQNIQETMDLSRKEGLILKNHIVQELPLMKNGIQFFFVTGPDGEKVEFVEIK